MGGEVNLKRLPARKKPELAVAVEYNTHPHPDSRILMWESEG